MIHVLPTGLRPMLATAGPLPPDDGWAHEVKWDGVRVLLAVEGGQVRATSRNGNDVTAAYPELQQYAALPDVLLDGEVVALGTDPPGVPDFGALQSRMHVRSPSPALVAATPVVLLPFDVLHLQDSSLLAQTYDERRGVLEQLLPDAPPSFTGSGQALLDSTRASGLEGVVAKRRDSSYLPGRRSDCWVKVKHIKRASALICGWKPGAGGRSGGIGSLLLGVHDDGALVYAGHVGTGFSAAVLRDLGDRLAPLERPTPAYDGPVPAEHARSARWVEPVLVCEVDYTEWTRDGRLRHPSYKGLRDDLFDQANPTEVPRD
jgi:bifunctional non-homologous end joining protein LigD